MTDIKAQHHNPVGIAIEQASGAYGAGQLSGFVTI